MNDQFSNSQFGFWRKWFWMGILMALFIIPGIIYGIAVAIEKDRRAEGIVIILFSIGWYFVLSAFFAWLIVSGAIPPYYQALQLR